MAEPEREVEFDKAAAEAREIVGEEGEPSSGFVAGEGTDASPASPGSAPEPPPSPVESMPEEAKKQAALFVATMLPFGVLVPFRGVHWAIDEKTARELAPYWSDVLDKYYPDWYRFAGPEVRLIGVLLPLVLARYQIEQAIMKQLSKQVDAASKPTEAAGSAASLAQAGAAPTAAAVGAGPRCLSHGRENCPECPETSGPSAAPPKKPN